MPVNLTKSRLFQHEEPDRLAHVREFLDSDSHSAIFAFFESILIKKWIVLTFRSTVVVPILRHMKPMPIAFKPSPTPRVANVHHE